MPFDMDMIAAAYKSLPAKVEAARTMLADPDNALDVLAREELGLNPDDLGSAPAAAGFSFVSFGAGAVVPLVPFFLGAHTIGGAAVLAAAGLFGVGAALSLFTGRRALWGGLRMLGIGAGAATLSYLLGLAFGVALG